MFYRYKRFYRIARIVAMFVIGLIVALFIALSQVDLETLRGELVTGLREATDLPVEIKGGISWKFSLRPKVRLDDVSVTLKPVESGKNKFSARRIDVTLNLFSLLRGKPTVSKIKIYDASLFIKQDEQYEKTAVKKKKQKNNEVVSQTNSKYPFNSDLGLDSIEVRNAVIHSKDSVYSLDGFYISSSSGNDSMEYSGWISSDSEIYPFIISFSEFNQERKVYPIRLAFSVDGQALIANVALEGTSKMPIDFILKGNIPNMKLLGNIFNVNLPETPPLNVDISGGVENKSFVLRKSYIRFNNSDVGISGKFDWVGSVPSISASINSKNFDLKELFPELYGHQSKSENKWIRPTRRNLNVFRDTPLYGELLKKYNINLEVNIDNFKIYREMEVHDIKVAGNLKNAEAHLDFAAKYAEGNVHVVTELSVDKNDRLIARATALGERIYVGEILEQVREMDSISELPANFEFYFEAHGYDLSGLMSTVTGPIHIYSVAPGYMNATIISDLYGEDFLTNLRHNIQDMFRSKKKYDQVKISCAAINLKVRNGIAETNNGVAVETNAINVRMAGNLNLGEENLKASMTTVPVRGLKLSITGNVINSVEFSGNLAEPDVKINRAAVAGKFASATGIGLMLAPFTGGIGLVAGAGVGLLAGGLLENWLSDEHPCQTAMEQGAPAKKGDPDWLNQPMSQLVGKFIK
ncbi:MAG TPA: AsmA family protein [Alphaproteobacteria bacterium]|nr:AsmA family protein [Alphaproteobacteria bacterium]